MSERSCDFTEFAVSITDILKDVDEGVVTGVNKAITQSIRRTAKKLRGEYTEGIGKHDWSDMYRSGFTSRTDKSGDLYTGEIGNKNKPGLVHLLEKGHATISGDRRTRAFKHMEPAYEDMADDFEQRVDEAVDAALGA